MRVRVDFPPPPVSYFVAVWPAPIVSSDEAWPPSIKGGRWPGGLHCTGALDTQLACVGWIESCKNYFCKKKSSKLGQIKRTGCQNAAPLPARPTHLSFTGAIVGSRHLFTALFSGRPLLRTSGHRLRRGSSFCTQVHCLPSSEDPCPCLHLV